MADWNLICSFERICATQVVCQWLMYTMTQSYTATSLNNNPSSVIILVADAKELEAKPTTKLSQCLMENKSRRHEVNLNANVNVKDNKLPSVLCYMSSTFGDEGESWWKNTDWKIRHIVGGLCHTMGDWEGRVSREISIHPDQKKKKPQAVRHMKTDGSVSRLKPG